MKWWTGREIIPNILEYIQSVRFVISGRLEPLIGNRNRQPTYLHTCTETLLRLCGPSNGDYEFAGFITVCPFHLKHISQVAMTPLIERPHQADAGLDGYDPSEPSDFIRSHDPPKLFYPSPHR